MFKKSSDSQAKFNNYRLLCWIYNPYKINQQVEFYPNESEPAPGWKKQRKLRYNVSYPILG